MLSFTIERMVWSVACVAVVGLAGCGGSGANKGQGQGGGGTTSETGGAGGTGGETTGTSGTKALPAGPQVVDLGGTPLKSPKVQLIAYAEDTFVTDVDAFITEFGTTNEWAEQTMEYGVGAFTKLQTIMIPGTPPTTLDDSEQSNSPFQQTLQGNVSGSSPAWAPEDGSTMYVFLLPLGTDINSGGAHCCTDFLGYHWEATIASGGVPYAVVCHCAMQKGDPLTPLQFVTTSVSHEMVEAATDPFVTSNTAYGQTDDADAIWTIATGGEVADMCEYNTDSNYQPPGAKYMLQRSWSNAASKAGTQPCVPPATTDPYFNSFAAYSDPVTFNYGGTWKTTGVNIAVGQSRTIPVALHSAAPTAGPWTVKAWDLNDFLGNTANTTVSLDKTSGQDGDMLMLTITVKSYASWSGAGVVLESTLNGQDNLTMFAVGQ
jgi:hypothetical protein